jgi:hypothetical protein
VGEGGRWAWCSPRTSGAPAATATASGNMGAVCWEGCPQGLGHSKGEMEEWGVVKCCHPSQPGPG